MTNKEIRRIALAVSMTAVTTGTVFSVKAQKIEDALKAISYEQFDKAKGILSRMNTPDAAYFLGNVYYRQGITDSAKAAFSKIPANSPYSAIGQALSTGSDGNAAAAKQALDRAASQTGRDYLATLEAGKAYLEIPGSPEQNSKSAVNVLNRAMAMKNKNDQVYLALGDAYIAINGGMAATNYTQAATVNPASPEPYVHLAALYRRARNAKESLANVAQGIAKDANFGPNYREQAETYRATQKFADAVASYEKYLSLTDRSISSRVRYIQFLYFADDFEKANSELADLKSHVKDFSKFPAMYRLDAISDYAIGIKNKDKAKLAAGLASMNQLFAQQSVKPLPIDYATLGKLQSANGNDSLAIQTLEKAITQDSAHAEDLYSALTDAYLAKKNYKGVAAMYDRRLSQGDTAIANYTFSGIYSYLGQANAKNPDTAVLHRADANLAKVVAKQPSYIPGYVYRGYVNVLLDPSTKRGLAQPYFQKIIELSTSDPKFQQQVSTDPKYKNYLVKAYEYMLYYNFQKKDMAGAKDIGQKLLAVDPKNEKAEAILKQK